LQPENNNEPAYDLGSIETQVKGYQVTIDINNIFDTSCIITMKVYGKYGWDWSFDFNYVAGDTPFDLFTEIQDVFSNYIADIPILLSADSLLNVLVFTFDLANTLSFTDFFVNFSDDADPSAFYTVQVLQDAISVEKTGALVPIEFTNVSSDQQVWATTKSKETEIIEGVLGAAASPPFFDPFFFLTFATPNLFVSGEEVYIYGNGIGAYVVLQNAFTSTQYVVLGSVNPVTNTCLFPNGAYTVVKNKRTASVIGYARKNYLNDVWSYTELIKSINLNFRTYKQIQAYGMITNNGTIYNWTDYLNQIGQLRCFRKV